MSRADRAGSSPARFAEPRALFIVAAVALTAFGLVMIFSASSIMALTSEATHFDPTYYVKRQAIFAVIGTGAAVFLACTDYHLWSERLLPLIWAGTLGLLLLIFTPLAQNAYGATRWISLGSFSLQPSEFAKITIVLVVAAYTQRYLEDRSFGDRELLIRGGLAVFLLLLCILRQPDKGTVLVCGGTMLFMLLLAGLPVPWVLCAAAIGGAGILGLAFFDDYSRARIMIMFDPWQDPYDKGYQLIQGFYAFGSGGLTGVGLGMSRQKYSYLPMAHNDFIYAVVGEELGLVGTLGVLLAFLFLLWQGYRIARHANDLSGRLIAAGASSMLVIQLLVNATGVLGILPLSGKPVPFLSYGGSSIMSSLMLVGLVVSVSLHSSLPETIYDERRSSFTLYEGMDGGGSGFRVLSGGRTAPDDLRMERDFSSSSPFGRITTNTNGSRRIDLGPSATDRLRGRDTGRGRRG